MIHQINESLFLLKGSINSFSLLHAVTVLLTFSLSERLLKLMDYYEGSFQDFIGHNDSVNIAKFSHDGKHLLTSAYSEIFVWEVTV